MQFDKPRIAIRERDLLDLFDLALHLVRSHWQALAVASIVGIVPFALFNYWLLRDLPLLEGQDYAWYTARMVMLVLFEVPLAAVPVTLLLGQAMFFERFDVARMVRQAWDSLPQLIAYQVVLRALWMPQAVFWEGFDRELAPLMVVLGLLWFIPYAIWPYL